MDNTEKTEDGKCSLVVKGSHTTNKACLFFRNDPDSIMDSLHRMFASEKLPRDAYLMVQYRYLNRREYKVVVFNGVVQYITIPTGKSCSSFSTVATGIVQPLIARDLNDRLKLFAKSAVDLFRIRCPYTNLAGLCRVDIMQSCESDGFALRVNEFESLEAAIGERRLQSESCVFTKMQAYYERNLTKKLNQIQPQI